MYSREVGFALTMQHLRVCLARLPPRFGINIAPCGVIRESSLVASAAAAAASGAANGPGDTFVLVGVVVVPLFLALPAPRLSGYSEQLHPVLVVFTYALAVFIFVRTLYPDCRLNVLGCLSSLQTSSANSRCVCQVDRSLFSTLSPVFEPGGSRLAFLFSGPARRR